MPRFDQSFSGLCEQNFQDTQQLKQRYLDAKAKRQPKSKQEKAANKQQEGAGPQGGGVAGGGASSAAAAMAAAAAAAAAQAASSIQSSVHVQQKFLKRPADDSNGGQQHDPGGAASGDSSAYEPPVKLQCTAQQQPGGGANQGSASSASAGNAQSSDGLTKFSVEIVQQLEFTTSAASSQPQQISTNVTVKTHANASVKSDVQAAGAGQQGQEQKGSPSTGGQKSNIGLETLVECVKQEPSSGTPNSAGGGGGTGSGAGDDFADLEQCAAALEKDAAATGGAGCFAAAFPDLIGDDTNDEIISSATFNDLISDISNYPDYELMKDFDFEDKPQPTANVATSQANHNQHMNEGLPNGMKVEDSKEHLMVDVKHSQSPLFRENQSNFSPTVFDSKPSSGGAPGNRLPSGYPNGTPLDFPKTELSPAAQTLKQMAEQHQHKTQMGGAVPTNAPGGARPGPQAPPNARSPYHDFQFQGGSGEYGSPNAPPSAGGFKTSPGHFAQAADVVKSEMMFQGSDFDIKRKVAAAASMYKQQQYSPYGSPGGNAGGSPVPGGGYLGRGGGTGGGPPGSAAQFGGGTPPRPPSGPGGGGGGPPGGGSGPQQGPPNGGGANVQISQAQQMSVSQQGHGHTISVSAGQHVHLSGDIKGNVSIAAQQGMHFTQQQQQQQQQQQSPMSTPQHQGSPMSAGMGGQGMGGMGAASMLGGQQGMGGAGNMSSNMSQGSMGGMGGPMGGMGGHGGGLGNMGSAMGGPNGGLGSAGGLGGPNNPMGGPNGMMGGLGGMPHPGMQHLSGMSHNDSYSMSQTQTINFTQQSLRRAGGPGMPMGSGTGGPVPGSALSQQMTNQQMAAAAAAQQQQQRMQQQAALDQQQKLLHQQQLLRAQQQQQQQQQYMAAAAAAAGAARPPPPDYKAAAAHAMMQGVQRYGPGPGPGHGGGPPPGPPVMRRMGGHQPMPPSGPMMRSNMYMLQQQQQQQAQQQLPQRAMYARQQGALAGMETVQQHNTSTEWRHLLISQQQNAAFNAGMRPSFQQGFMNANQMQQQQQQQQMSQLSQQQQLMRSAAAQQQSMASGGGPGQQMTQGQLMAAQSGAGGGQQGQMGGGGMSQAAMLQQMQQQGMQQQQNSHMSMSSLHMQQSQSISVASQQSLQTQQALSDALCPPNNQNNFPNPADFGFEFLDSLGPGDAGAFTDQELLNSFDSDAGFNLDF